MKSGDSAAGDVENLKRISESGSSINEKAYWLQSEILHQENEGKKTLALKIPKVNIIARP